jgi:hypothetical protein
MLKKTLGALLAVCLIPYLSNCAGGQINGVSGIPSASPLSSAGAVKENTVTKTISLNMNIKDLSLADITEIKIDGKTLDKKEYSLSSGKLILPELSEGKHVVSFSHVTLGETDIPIEVKNGTVNNFQFNITLNDNKIDSWEVGLDANLDGIIDQGSFFSKDFKSYVVVREQGGSLDYLPKEGYADDFRQDIRPPQPAGFNFPELKENEFRQSVTPPRGPAGSTTIQGDQLDYPFPANIAIPLSDKADILSGFRAVAITSENTIFPISTYIIENNFLILDVKTFKDQKLLNLYLIDGTGKGILLKIEAAKPLIEAPAAQVMPSAPPTGVLPGGQPPVPPSGAPGMPPRGPGQPPPPRNMPLPSGPPPQGNPGGDPGSNPSPALDGTSTLNLINIADLKLTVLDNIKLSEDDINKLTIYEEVFNPPQAPTGPVKKILLPVPNSINPQEGGYIRVTPEGEMVDFIPEKDFTPDSNTEILNSK